MTDEFDEVEAVVRIPKGGRLADSKKTEGWSRGFTPKSSGKSPEHVEIRLRTTGEQDPTVEPPAPIELTWVQQLVADSVSKVVDALVDEAAHRFSSWWDVG